jgi:hypothetical protein
MLRLLWHDYKYFPYERALAEREARTFFGLNSEKVEDGLLFKGEHDAATNSTALRWAT